MAIYLKKRGSVIFFIGLPYLPLLVIKSVFENIEVFEVSFHISVFFYCVLLWWMFMHLMRSKRESKFLIAFAFLLLCPVSPFFYWLKEYKPQNKNEK